MSSNRASVAENASSASQRRISGMNWSALRNRTYADFMMPSRLPEYRSLLEFALRHGYEVCSLRRFHRRLAEGLRPEERYLLLRHDVDTGVRTAQKMWAIEQNLGIQSSYYFRLRTIAPAFMRRIEQNGGEASYHFEELSSVAKSRRIRGRDEVPAIMPLARKLFARNLGRLRDRLGLRMEIVAGHGDWVNKILGVPNSAILASEAFRQEVGVELEAYDARLMNAVLKHSDAAVPGRWLWEQRDPLRSMEADVPAIQILVHPRHWEVERFVNLRDNASRSAEELCYRLGR
jgi:hypothetical protein